MINVMDRRERRYRYAVPALLSVPLLLLAACSSSSKSTAGNSPTGSSVGAGGTSSTATSGSDIKVMVIAPFALAVGPAKANFDAVRIQADDLNAKGGINGHKVDVIGCDDQSDPNVGAKCAEQAVSDHVVALVGEYSLVSNVIWPIITAAGIPSIGPIQYAALDQTAPDAWPVNPPVVFGEAAATGYLAKQKGCKAIADAQGDTGNSKLPEQLNKQVVAAAGVKYVGPFLLTVTGSLANAPAIAKSIVSKADCANIADGENGIALMKAILQLNPNFHFATTSGALPSNWPAEMGSGASAVNAVGGLAPDTSSAPGVQAYESEMKAKASGDTLNDFSEQAWASFYAFQQVASTIKGDITAKAVSQALGQASGVTTEGITGTINYTQATPLAGVTRLFSTQLFVTGAQDGKLVQVATVDAKDYLTS
jgi:ABC-type branched-subunit amino acid transport system substrate-binding protein